MNPDYENLPIEVLDTLSIRPLRELALHNAGIQLMSDDNYNFTLTKLNDLEYEIHRRRTGGY